MSLPTTTHGFAEISWVSFSPAAACSGIPNRLNSALLHLLYWYSCLANIQILALAASSSQSPYDYKADDLISASAVEKVLLLICKYVHTVRSTTVLMVLTLMLRFVSLGLVLSMIVS